MSGLKGGIDYFVGIDVSKDKFDACGITGKEAKLFQISAAMNRAGFEKLKRHLGTVSVSSVLIGMESTASYHAISSLILLLRVIKSFLSIHC